GQEAGGAPAADGSCRGETTQEVDHTTPLPATSNSSSSSGLLGPVPLSEAILLAARTTSSSSSTSPTAREELEAARDHLLQSPQMELVIAMSESQEMFKQVKDSTSSCTERDEVHLLEKDHEDRALLQRLGKDEQHQRRSGVAKGLPMSPALRVVLLLVDLCGEDCFQDILHDYSQKKFSSLESTSVSRDEEHDGAGADVLSLTTQEHHGEGSRHGLPKNAFEVEHQQLHHDDPLAFEGGAAPTTYTRAHVRKTDQHPAAYYDQILAAELVRNWKTTGYAEDDHSIRHMRAGTLSNRSKKHQSGTRNLFRFL
ncbi:unnamed protein product, partial [Amoebophrya sp. A120]